MKLKLNSGFLGLFFILAGFVVSAHAKTSYEKFPVPAKGGVFTDTIGLTPGTLNPILVTSIDDSVLSEKFYMPLMDKDAETYEDFPALAEKVEISKDKKDYTFTLNKNAKWSDGTPVTSNDVEFTFQKIMDPKVDAASTRSYYDGVSFQKIDALKFKFTVAVPKFNSLSTLTTFHPVQKKQFENETDFNKSRENLHPIGNNAYKLKTISRDQFVTLERDQNWWARDLPAYRPQANFDTIQLKIISDPALRYENFLKGSIDTVSLTADQYATQALAGDKDKIGDKPNSGKALWASKFPSDGSLPWYGLALNQKNAILSSLPVRQALAYLIDYDVVNERAFFNTVKQCVSPFGSRTDNVPPELRSGAKKYKYDFKKALGLLKADGWADTDGDGFLDKMIDGKKIPLKIEFKTYSASQAGMKTAQILKESFKKAGIDLQIRPMEGSALYADFHEKNFDIAFMGWGAGSIYPDPRQIWHTKSISANGSNSVSYSNPKVDQLIDKANLEFDKKKRAKLLQEINRELYHDLPYIFLVERGYVIEGLNSKLKAPVWIQRYGIDVTKELFHL